MDSAQAIAGYAAANGSAVLDYLRVILTGPTVLLVLVVAALILFAGEIRDMISRIARLKFPGGSELIVSQRERDANGGERETPEPSTSSRNDMTGDGNPLPNEIEELKKLYSSEQTNARLWEYKFLNYFLVYQTQKVLDWLAYLTDPVSYSLLDNIWSPVIPSSDERKAIIQALKSHHLINDTNGLIGITPKGKDYVKWRGVSPT